MQTLLAYACACACKFLMGVQGALCVHACSADKYRSREGCCNHFARCLPCARVNFPCCCHVLQALRQSLLKKYARIRNDMDRLHNQRLSPYEKIEALESIRCQIQGSWRTDEIRRQKPSPQVLGLVAQCSVSPCCQGKTHSSVTKPL